VHEVTDRAGQVLSKLESGQIAANAPKTEYIPAGSCEREFPNEAAEHIKSLDISTLTPIEAINELYTLQMKLKED